MTIKCIHNERTRYTDGFYCRECLKFFPKDSPTYRSSELLTTLWMICWNINAESLQKKMGGVPEALAMADKIGVGIEHKSYEELITEAEKIIFKYGKNYNSASFMIG